MNTEKQIVGYTRVSTSGQVEDGAGLEIQRSRISEYCQQNGLALSKIYEDKAMSGTMRERPALLELLKDVEEKRIKQVIVYRQDRLSREIGLTIFIDNILCEHDVQLTSILEPIIDLNGDGLTKLIRRMLALMSEYERELIASRLSEGRRNNAKNGKRGSGPIPFGYTKVGDHLEINPEETKWVKKMFRWAARGKSYSVIAGILNKKNLVTKRGNPFQLGSVKCVLGNPYYYGDASYGTISGVGRHQPIISKRLFMRVNPEASNHVAISEKQNE